MNDGLNIIIPPETLFEALIRYGLYLGAGFQLMCLAACIFLPGNSSNGAHKIKGEDNDDSESEMSTPKKPAPTATHHRRKVDKKKRR